MGKVDFTGWLVSRALVASSNMEASVRSFHRSSSITEWQIMGGPFPFGTAMPKKIWKKRDQKKMRVIHQSHESKPRSKQTPHPLKPLWPTLLSMASLQGLSAVKVRVWQRIICGPPGVSIKIPSLISLSFVPVGLRKVRKSGLFGPTQSPPTTRFSCLNLVEMRIVFCHE